MKKIQKINCFKPVTDIYTIRNNLKVIFKINTLLKIFAKLCTAHLHK